MFCCESKFFKIRISEGLGLCFEFDLEMEILNNIDWYQCMGENTLKWSLVDICGVHISVKIKFYFTLSQNKLYCTSYGKVKQFVLLIDFINCR
jgi:hypothetical protein